MRSLLDEMVDAMMAGPVIVSEQHDTSKIDVEARAWDQAEGGGMTIAAANRMAALDTSTGKVAVMVAGKPAWHELGVTVAEAVGSKDALRLASLDWQVKKQPLSYLNPITGQHVEAPGAFGVVRQDTGAVLGTVGSRYRPIQNADRFDMLDGVLSEYWAKYEAAGSRHGSARAFMLVRLPEQAFDIGHRDHVKAYAPFTNPHGGSGMAECFVTSERVVCANTLRVARNRAKGGLRIRHTGSIKSRVAGARSALGITCREFERFAEDAAVLARTAVPDIRHYCNAVLDVTLAGMKKGADLLAAMIDAAAADRELARKSFEKQIERRGEILQDLLERYESERCGFNGQRGTVWAALNAVTESADYGKLAGRFTGTENQRASRRFESILVGQADEAEQMAYQRAMTLAT
jgi:phage/plasmid-like protein (TIGR03299 family)